MNTMNYRGYAARIEYSDEADCLIGHIAGINDIVDAMLSFSRNKRARARERARARFLNNSKALKLQGRIS